MAEHPANTFHLVRTDSVADFTASLMAEVQALVERRMEAFFEAGGQMVLSAPPAPPVPPPAVAQASGRGAPLPPPPPREPSHGKKYRVAKGGSTTYGEIVLNEISEPEFELLATWRELEPLVETESGRAAETFRRSIANDKRFVRVEDREGLWFRKVGAGEPAQSDLLTEPEQAETEEGA